MVDFFKVDEKVADDSILVLIIYDIENNKNEPNWQSICKDMDFVCRNQPLKAL